MTLDANENIVAADFGEIEIEEDEVRTPGASLGRGPQEHIDTLSAVLGHTYIDVSFYLLEGFLEEADITGIVLNNQQFYRSM